MTKGCGEQFNLIKTGPRPRPPIIRLPNLVVERPQSDDGLFPITHLLNLVAERPQGDDGPFPITLVVPIDGRTGKSLDRRVPYAGGLPRLLSGKQILIVDDNAVNCKVAAGALKKYGAEVTCADSGKVAIQMLKPPHKFDACFMDVQMPEMDGYSSYSSYS